MEGSIVEEESDGDSSAGFDVADLRFRRRQRRKPQSLVLRSGRDRAARKVWTPAIGQRWNEGLHG